MVLFAAHERSSTGGAESREPDDFSFESFHGGAFDALSTADTGPFSEPHRPSMVNEGEAGPDARTIICESIQMIESLAAGGPFVIRPGCR